MGRNKIDCLKGRACILQTFYHKNMFKNTNYKINFIVKLIFLKKIVILTVQRTFFFDHLAFDILIFLRQKYLRLLDKL